MAGNKQVDAGRGKADGVNKGPDSLSGRSDPADPDTGQSQQNSGHYTGSPGAETGADAGRDGGIVSAPPESNVGPAGAPQSSRGSATEPIPGGTTGIESGEKGMGAAAAGGNPGTSADMPAPGSQGGATDAAVAGSAVEDLARESPEKPGGGDTR